MILMEIPYFTDLQKLLNVKVGYILLNWQFMINDNIVAWSIHLNQLCHIIIITMHRYILYDI